MQVQIPINHFFTVLLPGLQPRFISESSIQALSL